VFIRIDHVEIVPADFDRSLAFYTDILGFTVRERLTVERPPLRDIVFLELGSTVLELLDFDRPAPPSREAPQVGYRMMALEVKEMQEALAYLAEKGIEPSAPPLATAGGWRAEIRDPDGLPIELRQWGASAAE
jgi:glyoxylase I family protein